MTLNEIEQLSIFRLT